MLIAEADPAGPEALALISALDRDLGARYPGLPIHGIDAANFRGAGATKTRLKTLHGDGGRAASLSLGNIGAVAAPSCWSGERPEPGSR